MAHEELDLDSADYDDFDDVSPGRMRELQRGGSSPILLTVAAIVVAVSSLVTAGAAVTMALQSQDRADERVAELIAAMESRDPGVRILGDASSAAAGEAGNSATRKGTRAKETAVGGATSTGESARGAASAVTGSAGASDSRGDSASAEQNGATGATGAAMEDAEPAMPVATPNILLANTMAASDNSVSSPDRYYWAVDGAAAGPTLDQVAESRERSAPPPGMESRGIGGITFEVRDVVMNGNTATATLVLIFPGEWGKWEYPDSGFQYLDGEWKLQKSAVCNLAEAAWVDCY